jgi:hypothetical protein
MNGDPLQPVSSGQPFRMRADTMNLLAAAARSHQMGKFRVGRRPKLAPLAPGHVWIKNDSGAARARFDILRFTNGTGNVLFDPTASQLDQFHAWPAFSGGEPSNFLPFAVLQEPIPSGEIGRALVSGITAVQVDIKEKGHRYAVPSVTTGSSGSTGDYDHLRSADCGTPIVWRPDATGKQWCCVAMGPYTDEFYAKITSVDDWGSTGSDRKSYGFAEVYKTGSAYGNWSSLSGGWSGTAYNLIEELDREPTKITLSGHPTITLDLRPRVGECVKMKARWYDGSLEYWFEYPIGHAAASGS